jgi:predicted dienelactone hydrolase
MLRIATILTLLPAFAGAHSIDLVDPARPRPIAVELTVPANCTRAQPCPVALLSPGYGMSHLSYGFVTDVLREMGYAVASIKQQLPTDPKMDGSGNMQQMREMLWKQGAQNIEFVRNELARRQLELDWRRLLLVGHSLGGDSSAAYAATLGTAAALITLDNRRASLPRAAGTKVLSIRASDTEADPGVLPSAEERAHYGACIVRIPGSRHNDMADDGSPELKHSIVRIVRSWLKDGSCAAP